MKMPKAMKKTGRSHKEQMEEVVLEDVGEDSQGVTELAREGEVGEHREPTPLMDSSLERARNRFRNVSRRSRLEELAERED